MVHQTRAYRNYVKAQDLTKFEIIEKETDLLVLAKENLYDKALAYVLKYRSEIEKYIAQDPQFAKTLSPYRIRYDAPPIIKEMASAARRAKVGPMATVAGTLAEFVGKDLMIFSDEVVVENNGDIFLKISSKKNVALYTGNSKSFTGMAMEIEPRKEPFAICSSTGNDERVFSFGKADAVYIIAKSTPLADAAATAIGNLVKDVSDIDEALKKAKRIRGLDGVLIIKDDQLGALGRIKLVSL